MSIPIVSEANRRLRVLWILAFWLVVGVSAYVFGVLSSAGQRAEDNVLSASQFTTDPPAPLGLVSPMTIVIALIALGLVALWVHGIIRTLIVVLVPGLAIVASQLLKSDVLWRPDLLSIAENSFPSGHMTVFTVVVAAAVYAVPRQIRALTAAGGAVLLGIVAWQLLAYGWHRPSDVLGALALGVASFAAVTLLTPLKPSGGVWLVRTTSIGLAMVGWIMIAASLVLAFIAWRASSADLLLNAGQFGAIALCMLASHSLLRLAILSRSAKE